MAGYRIESRIGLASDAVPLHPEDDLLAQVRAAGYAIENEEATVGDAGIAAPILGRDDLVAGAVSVVGSAERLLAPGTRDDLVRAVATATRAISRDLGAGRGGVAALSLL